MMKQKPVTETITVDGLIVQVERKAIRGVYLRVRPEDSSVHVSAPRRLSHGQLADFIRRHRRWIDQRRAATALAEMDVLPLWGRAVPLRTVEGPASLTLDRDGAVLSLPAGSSDDMRQTLLDTFYRSQLAAALPEAVAWAEERTGLHAGSWQLRRMRSRWGSCTPGRRSIRLNTQLALYPPACLRYVLIHELAHLRVPNHGPAFAALMDSFLPAWRTLRRALQGNPLATVPVSPEEVGLTEESGRI